MLTIVCANAANRSLIDAVIDGYGPAFRAWLAYGNTRVVVLTPGQTYRNASPTLRAIGYDGDDREFAPEGVFVREEATLYLRVVSRLTIAHEIVHAYDLARGTDGAYLSSSPEIRAMYSAPTCHFVTPYGATNPEEYFAEQTRAYHDNGNDPTHPWPQATRAKLRERDPAMYAYLRRLLRETPPGRAATAA
jgi:hypothetical protein